MRGFSNYTIWCVEELLTYLGSLLWQQALLTQYIRCNFNSKLPSKEQEAFMDLNSTVTMSLRNKALYMYSRTKLILSEQGMLALLICSVLNTYYKRLTITGFLRKFHFRKYRSDMFVHSLFLSLKILRLVKNDGCALLSLCRQTCPRLSADN